MTPSRAKLWESIFSEGDPDELGYEPGDLDLPLEPFVSPANGCGSGGGYGCCGWLLLVSSLSLLKNVAVVRWPQVSVRGQCLIPPFYASVASRGLNLTMLTTEELIGPYLSKEQQAQQAQQEQQVQMQIAKQQLEQAAKQAKKAVSTGDGADGDESGVLGNVAEFLMNIFSKGNADASAASPDGTTFKMSVGEDGALSIEATSPDGQTSTVESGMSVTFSPPAEIATCPAEGQQPWHTPEDMCSLESDIAPPEAPAEDRLVEAEAAAMAEAVAAESAAAAAVELERQAAGLEAEVTTLTSAIKEVEMRAAEDTVTAAEQDATTAAKRLAVADVRWKNQVHVATSIKQQATESRGAVDREKRRPPSVSAGRHGVLPAAALDAVDRARQVREHLSSISTTFPCDFHCLQVPHTMHRSQQLAAATVKAAGRAGQSATAAAAAAGIRPAIY